MLSRGIDFADVKLVMQLHPPKEAVQYIHRSGRTGRAGQGGTCITFYDASERKLLQRVRAVTNRDFAMLPLPGPLDIHNAPVSRLLEQIFSVWAESSIPPLGVDSSNKCARAKKQGDHGTEQILIFFYKKIKIHDTH